MNIVILLLCCALATDVYTFATDLRTLLRDEVELSEKDLQKLGQGEVLIRLLDTDKKPEVAVLGIMRVDVPADFFVDKYRDIELFTKADRAAEVGTFTDPPESGNLEGMTLDSSDLQAIRECKVGDCNIKLPASVMDHLRQKVDWSQPECMQQVTGQVKQMLVDYVGAYLIRGNSAMGQYDDQTYPLRMADEFHELLQEPTCLDDNVPELYEYLEFYPKINLSSTEAFVYWSKKKYGNLRPILSLNHVTIVRVPSGIVKTLIASKQIYASHYFEASLELTALIEYDKASELTGFILVHLNRSRLDALRRTGPPGMKDRIRKGVLDKIGEEMRATKSQIEALYQE